LVALNLAGAVGDTEKQEVQELLNDWYNAGTLRVINASEDNPKTFTYKGNEVTVTKGMDDCFNSDTTMLASSKREYMNSEVRALLIKKGTDVTSEYTGLVTEWMGGYENQVEFTTEELISYDGQNEGEYMEVYYLVSKMEDEWVIDERTVLSEKTVNDSELSTIQSRLSN
jgi:hypothetical protein